MLRLPAAEGESTSNVSSLSDDAHTRPEAAVESERDPTTATEGKQ
jgi:hypothetical protein